MSVSYKIVIRSVNERTAVVQKQLLSKQTDMEGISTISEIPFENTLKEVYRTGYQSNAEWLFTFDADVIPFNDAVDTLKNITNKLPRKCFHAECKVYDKLKNEWRKAGNRIYRVEYLKEVLALLPKPGNQVRPESYTINKMIEKGYESAEFWLPIGIHDFEQYYSDLYRKAYAYSGKFKHSSSEIIDKWKILSNDDDFKVCLKGIQDGLNDSDKIEINKQAYIEKAQKALVDLGLTEKSTITDVDSIIKLANEVRENNPLDEKPWILYRRNSIHIPEKEDNQSGIHRIIKKFRGFF